MPLYIVNICVIRPCPRSVPQINIMYRCCSNFSHRFYNFASVRWLLPIQNQAPTQCRHRPQLGTDPVGTRMGS